MSRQYHLQRWQLHGQLQQARDLLHTLEQQLSQIDRQLQSLEPDAVQTKKPMEPMLPCSVAVIRQQPVFPLPIAAG